MPICKENTPPTRGHTHMGQSVGAVGPTQHKWHFTHILTCRHQHFVLSLTRLDLPSLQLARGFEPGQGTTNRFVSPANHFTRKLGKWFSGK